MRKINWQFFPKSEAIPLHLKEVVTIFEKTRILLVPEIINIQVIKC
jgi:hypothetical protein